MDGAYAESVYGRAGLPFANSVRLARGVGNCAGCCAGVLDVSSHGSVTCGVSTLHARVIVRAASISVAVALHRDAPCDIQAAAGVCLKLTPVVH